MAFGVAMKRVIVTALLGLLFQAAWQGFAAIIPQVFNVFFLPPLILVFSLQYFKPLEAIILCLIGGAIIDAIGGFLIGVNMILLLILAFFLGATHAFSKRTFGLDSWIYVGACSLLYRGLFLIVQTLTFGSEANAYISQLLFGPLVDVAIGSLFFPVLVKVLHWVKAFEQNEFFKVKIGSRL